jgi:hypothetical protein
MCSKKQKYLCINNECIVCLNRSILNLEMYQQLIDEFDIEKNDNINLLNLPYGSHKKIWWKCKNNHTFNVTLNSRTNNTTSCKICKYDERTKNIELKKQTKEKILNYKIDTVNNQTNETGVKNEKYVYNLLKNIYDLEEVQLIGHLGGLADIIIKINNYNDNYKLLQIKTLTKINETSYYMTNSVNYPDNLLIAMVDNTHKYFALEFAGNIKVKRLALYYNNDKSKYKNLMFRSEEDFINNILEKLPLSTDVKTLTETLTECQKKEYYMRQRLKNKCIELGLNYEDNDINYDTVDCYINNIPIQLKYASINQKHRNTISITMRKSCGRIGLKHIKQSYNINDLFEYVIIELENSPSNFCIIPKQELANKKCISTNDTMGTGICYIMPYNNGINHWSNNYWDKWDFLCEFNA